MSPYALIGILVVAAFLVVAVRLLEGASPPLPGRGWRVPAALLIAAAAVWYFEVYDTAEGRCGRGDFGACLVYEAQTTQP